MKRIVFAAVLAAALWGLQRWFDGGRRRSAQAKVPPTEFWENEGGALAPNPAGLETSQVPR